MSKKKKKYYTVWQGHKKGVFKTWNECKAQIKDFQGAQYKSFPTLEAAEEALKGNIPKAIEHLKKAVVFEDGLTYTEPAAWHIPTRQNLGAVLLKAENYDVAEKIYKEDLNILRQNGWSLMGLYKSLTAQGKNKEAEAIKKEFDKAWKDADIEIETSIL